jgi:hypothetical protein
MLDYTKLPAIIKFGLFEYDPTAVVDRNPGAKGLEPSRLLC